ncbi:uncharacterized protein LOC124664585 [Lolium rigidum]|uniref:uncharacterized protein LOC124664585 n=1 Tax=Lolium rigidum TaxID=89674 RepID=UPI001F5C85E2|nr:uncharacterized protein LOC124664585 [Lolium rigidum]
MAGQVCWTVMIQAMQAKKTIRPQRDRLLQLRRQMEQLSPGDDDDHKSRNMELASGLFNVCYSGLGIASRMLASCMELAAKDGARLAINRAFAAMPDEQLHDALVAQRLPARPTTQTEAFSRVEAAFNAVKVTEEHHIPLCIQHLVGQRPVHMVHGKNGLENPAPVPDTPVDLDKARDYLDRACTLADLAVKHIDLAVVVLSSFMDPKVVANLCEVTDKRASILQGGPYPAD